jgi:peptidoglycan-associated lipoprotein
MVATSGERVVGIHAGQLDCPEPREDFSMNPKPRAVTTLALALPLLVVLVLTGCSKNKEVAEATPPPAPAPVETPASTPPPAPADPAPAETAGSLQEQLKDIFFDYDAASLSSEAQGTLDANGKLLMDNASASVQIEGHCDERGTVEYNLSLGDRRAQAARDYLVRYGVPAARLSVVSYGEERPFSTGGDEAAWAQNRRAHFVVR